MSLTSFHSAHNSHSIVKAFVPLSSHARRRIAEMTRAAVKREPLEAHQRATPSRHVRQPTTELPERSCSHRAASVISINSQAPDPQPNSPGNDTMPDSDPERAAMNGESTVNGLANGFCDGDHAINGHAADAERASPAPTLTGESTVIGLANGFRDGDHAINGHAADAERASPAPTLNGDNDSDFDLLGQHSLPLFELSQHLERLGIANTLPSLPKATLVGEQNHGKSSVGEALSGISFPREEGTCTRAPFEVTVSPAEPDVDWEVSIQLLIKYDYTPKTKARGGYAGWTERTVPWTINVKTTRDRKQAATLLQDAQLAILNPPYEGFSGGNCPRPAGNGVGFTPNVIQVHVRCRTRLSLSFIDLPGLVHRLPPKEQYLVDLIRKLVQNYIQQPNALILLTHQSDVDLSVTQAYDLVVKAGAQDRCIGILTKPDKSEDSDARMDIVHGFLRGDMPLGGRDSWFVTKQLSSNDLASGVTHAEARAMEEAFFSRSPWTDNLAIYQSRFGTPNLARAISIRLRNHIQLQLPDMLEKVQARLEQVQTELQTFPKPSDSPIHTVQRVIEKVAKSIYEAVAGDGLINDFSTKFGSAVDELKSQLDKACPIPVMQTPGYEPHIVDINSDESAEEDESPTKKAKGNLGQPLFKLNSTPLGRGKTPAFPRTPTSKRAKSEHRDTPAAPSSCIATEFTLDEIRDMMKRYSNRSIAVQVHPRVTERLIKKAQGPWPIIVDGFLQSVWRLLSETLNTCVRDTLPQNTILKTETAAKLKAFVLALWTNEREEVRRMVQREMLAKITHQDVLLVNTSSNEERLEKRRLRERVKEHFEEMEQHASKQDKSKIPKTPDMRMARKDELGPDEYSREVKAMAEPIAYYKLSAARMLDGIAVRLNSELLVPIENQTLHELQVRLNSDDQAACVELLAEDPERERKRRQLVAECEHLAEAGNRVQQALYGHAMQQ